MKAWTCSLSVRRKWCGWCGWVTESVLGKGRSSDLRSNRTRASGCSLGGGNPVLNASLAFKLANPRPPSACRLRMPLRKAPRAVVARRGFVFGPFPFPHHPPQLKLNPSLQPTAHNPEDTCGGPWRVDSGAHTRTRTPYRARGTYRGAKEARPDRTTTRWGRELDHPQSFQISIAHPDPTHHATDDRHIHEDAEKQPKQQQ